MVIVNCVHVTVFVLSSVEPDKVLNFCFDWVNGFQLRASACSPRLWTNRMLHDLLMFTKWSVYFGVKSGFPPTKVFCSLFFIEFQHNHVRKKKENKKTLVNQFFGIHVITPYMWPPHLDGSSPPPSRT